MFHRLWCFRMWCSSVITPKILVLFTFFLSYSFSVIFNSLFYFFVWVLKELCHGYCACLHLTDANDVNKAVFMWVHVKSLLALSNLHRDSLFSFFFIFIGTFCRNEPFFGTIMYPCINLATIICRFCSQQIKLYSSWTSEYHNLFHSIARNLVNIISFLFAQDNVPNSCWCTSTCSTKAARKRTACPC